MVTSTFTHSSVTHTHSSFTQHCHTQLFHTHTHVRDTHTHTHTQFFHLLLFPTIFPAHAFSLSRLSHLIFISTISPSAPSASSASSDLLSTARPVPHTLLFHHTFILLCLPSRASFRPLPLGLNASDLQLATLFARGHVAAVAACIRSGACFQSHCELTIAVPTPELRLTQVDSG